MRIGVDDVVESHFILFRQHIQRISGLYGMDGSPAFRSGTARSAHVGRNTNLLADLQIIWVNAWVGSQDIL